MAIVNTDFLQGNYKLTLQASDPANSIVFNNASNLDVSTLTVANVSTIASNTGNITLNPAGLGVNISSKALLNAANILFIPGTDPGNVNTLWANSGGVYFSAGTSGGSIKLARSLREAYGNVAQDANIAVSSYPVNFTDAGATANIINVLSVGNLGIFGVSNTAVTINRATSIGANLSVTGRSTFTGDVAVTGNMSVTGNITTINSQQVNIQDPVLYLNSGYNTVAGKNGGIAVNYLPTANTVTVPSATFTPGVVATSNPTVNLPSAQAWAVDGVIMQVSGSSLNDGIYEILSSTASLLTIRGVGTSSNGSNLQNIVANQFLTETGTTNVVLRQINIGVVQVSTGGTWQTASGSSNTTLAFKPIGNVTFSGGAPLANQLSYFTDTTGGNISAANVTVSGANLTAAGNISAGNLLATAGLYGASSTLTLPSANVTATTLTTPSGANSYVYSSKTQTTTIGYANCAVFSVGVPNAVIYFDSYVHGKQTGVANSITVKIEGGFIADSAGNVTAMTNNIKNIFRNTGTSTNYNANVIVAGANVVLQVQGETAQTVNWTALSTINYGTGFT